MHILPFRAAKELVLALGAQSSLLALWQRKDLISSWFIIHGYLMIFSRQLELPKLFQEDLICGPVLSNHNSSIYS